MTGMPARTGRPAVFLDRDGVVNEDRDYVGTVEDFVLIDGVVETVRKINEAGVLVFVVTNQSGVARGFYPESAVGTVHDHMRRELAQGGAHVDDIRYCPHHPEAPIAAYRKDCACRKPLPGMIRDLMQVWQVDAARAIMIGDKPRDAQSGIAAGIEGVVLEEGMRLADVVDAFLMRIAG